MEIKKNEECINNIKSVIGYQFNHPSIKCQAAETHSLILVDKVFSLKVWEIIAPYVNSSSVLVFLQVSSRSFFFSFLFFLLPWKLFFSCNFVAHCKGTYMTQTKPQNIVSMIIHIEYSAC